MIEPAWISLQEWLDTPCSPTEIAFDGSGEYLKDEDIKRKIKYMEKTYKVTVNQGNFQHSMYTTLDKRDFVHGSIELEIMEESKEFPFHKVLFKRLVGAYSFPVLMYDYAGNDNPYYLNTVKTLAIRNALLEFEQFGASLNKKELKAKQNAIRNGMNGNLSDDKMLNTLKKIGKK